MTVTMLTDRQSDMMLSLRASARVPLPREIALCDPALAFPWFERMRFYENLGLAGHPLVEVLGRRTIDMAMASAVSRAPYLDRVTHYASHLGFEGVSIVDLTAPTRDDPEPRPDRASGASYLSGRPDSNDDRYR